MVRGHADSEGGTEGVVDHKDGDPDKSKEEYDKDNHADQMNPNNEECEQD
jgi:hypothetical protein